MKIIGVIVDHFIIQRWGYKFPTLIESKMKKKKGKVGASWRLHETYIKEKGIWCYLYRVVNKLENTIDFLLTKKRQRMSAQSFLIKAIRTNCKPKLTNIDKSDSNTAAINVYYKQ